MILKEKIDYMSKVFGFNEDSLNWLQEHGKEVLVTHDGKYLFACKLYSGI